ncbi:GtrA family protein [Prauserella cavernicola]|uniref:GtrA family protein n=1 Tax=Prauserella cavernicola TaxID=2800127 RepID=A0A934QVQ5_9PSEU|nr:GtrA family protein [Prauserella cavernicola]MBK1786484.1 GtrA family protein [Prauserella cavernicola]
MASVTASPGEPRPAALARIRHGWVRYALLYLAAGATTTGLQALVYLAARAPFDPQAANLVAIGLTTLLNTEFHRRITFANSESPPARRHLQTVLTFAYYAAAGSVALGALDALSGSPTRLEETTVLVATSLAGGICRFLVLRSWVFVSRVKMDS